MTTNPGLPEPNEDLLVTTREVLNPFYNWRRKRGAESVARLPPGTCITVPRGSADIATLLDGTIIIGVFAERLIAVAVPKAAETWLEIRAEAGLQRSRTLADRVLQALLDSTAVSATQLRDAIARGAAFHQPEPKD